MDEPPKGLEAYIYRKDISAKRNECNKTIPLGSSTSNNNNNNNITTLSANTHKQILINRVGHAPPKP